MPNNGEFTVPTEFVNLNEVMKRKSYIKNEFVAICESYGLYYNMS